MSYLCQYRVAWESFQGYAWCFLDRLCWTWYTTILSFYYVCSQFSRRRLSFCFGKRTRYLLAAGPCLVVATWSKTGASGASFILRHVHRSCMLPGSLSCSRPYKSQTWHIYMSLWLSSQWSMYVQYAFRQARRLLSGKRLSEGCCPWYGL